MNILLSHWDGRGLGKLSEGQFEAAVMIRTGTEGCAACLNFNRANEQRSSIPRAVKIRLMVVVW